jgi:hypothetical protein
MSGLTDNIVLAIEFLSGAAAGIAIGRYVRSYSLTWIANGLVGGIGGLLFVWPFVHIPGAARLLGHLAEGLTPTMVIGAAMVGAIGGAILMLLAGLLKALARG